MSRSVAEEIGIFSEEYYLQELESFKVAAKKYNSVEIKIIPEMTGRIDGYMHTDFYDESNALRDVPVFYIDGELWMSLTPMEVQSHYTPIAYATGRVGVAGLGLGYYVQRILDIEEVEEVIVYEINQDVIDLYTENFGTHPKLTIKKEDFHTIEGEYFDFFYCDIYPEMTPRSGIHDMAEFQSRNEVETYHFWTQETLVLAMFQDRIFELPFSWSRMYYGLVSEVIGKYRGLVTNIDGGEAFYEELCDRDLV